MCRSTAPFHVSLAFALDALGQFKRRACHQPASCSPRGATLSPQGGFGGKRVAVTGSAAVQQDGTLALVTRHADNQAGSAFLTKPLPLLHGFNATFTFRLNDPCTSIFSCPSLSGGFAFVLRAGAVDADPPPAVDLRAIRNEWGPRRNDSVPMLGCGTHAVHLHRQRRPRAPRPRARPEPRRSRRGDRG